MNTSKQAANTQGSILVVDDDEMIQRLVAMGLRKEGYDVVIAANGKEALARLSEATPDLIISDVMMPELDGFNLLEQMRANPTMCSIPVIMLTSRSNTKDVIRGLKLGADDYLVKPFQVNELCARVRAKLERPPVPKEFLARDMQTGLLSESVFAIEVAREASRIARGGAPGALAYLSLNEMPRLREQFGSRVEAEIAKQMVSVVQAGAIRLELAAHSAGGRFALLLPEVEVQKVRQRLAGLAQSIAHFGFRIHGERLRLTPTIGFATLDPALSYDQVRDRALKAQAFATAQLDLEPRGFGPEVESFVRKQSEQGPSTESRQQRSTLQGHLALPIQLAVTFLLSLVVPFLVYRSLDQAGFDITPVMYIAVVIALLVTAATVWLEGLYAIRTVNPPEMPSSPYPVASAIIAAYLPNEAATILETLDAFLRIEYPAPLQLILAYNTPREMPIEQAFKDLAARHPNFCPMRVRQSESKAQNVNAALSEVTGEFVGVFDADHHPAPDSFMRAWRWLSNGCDVVQGHCQVRNGDASWVTRMTAVEFEAIYAVSHPGRSRLHGFGIFGGSNGYWKRDLLKQMRMHGFMLTEDIDSSLRATELGYKIVSDPLLVSRELAPATITALLNQRLRWAQGWFQVSRKHFWQAMRSRMLSPRQKVGIFYLLGWREFYPWLSVQMFPIIAYWALKYGGLDRLDWLVPIFVLTTVFTLSVGPGQTILAYKLGTPEIRQHRRWFWFYLIMASLFYTELKNVVARVAQIKEAMGERTWRVTPRSQAGPAHTQGAQLR